MKFSRVESKCAVSNSCNKHSDMPSHQIHALAAEGLNDVNTHSFLCEFTSFDSNPEGLNCVHLDSDVEFLFLVGQDFCYQDNRDKM